MADVKGQVDWQALGQGGNMSGKPLSVWLRTTFEPLVKAAGELLAEAEPASNQEIELRDGIIALRAALDGLPKVGG